ncbi:MAG TPA: DUF2281 domain-containing protein [Phaeodactylibacter sp.]|nr:DUF2281 domain-containing protein [Phaeodactylibacter sp.]
MVRSNMYSSVLKKLSTIPYEYLKDVDNFLTSLNSKINSTDRRSQILELAGSWKDMNQEDFDEYMKSIKDLRDDMFDKEVEL